MQTWRQNRSTRPWTPRRCYVRPLWSRQWTADLTNVADALDGPHGVEQLVIMGGDITSGEPEHNIACDVAAAQAVFAAGCRRW